MKQKNPAPEEFVRKMASKVTYDPESGRIFWKACEDAPAWWNSKFAGKECGGLQKDGYRGFSMQSDSGIKYWMPTHRVVWFILYGRLPSKDIRHIDGKRDNNRPENLAECERSEMALKYRKQNCKNKTGITGVSFHKQIKKHQAKIVIKKQLFHLGTFEDKQAAEQALINFRKERGID